jgi:hypothetical protein
VVNSGGPIGVWNGSGEKRIAGISGGPAMNMNSLRAMSCALLASCLTISVGLMGSENPAVFSGLTAHEWGTFTSIAGEKGQAVEWSPLTDSTDLPEFVEHFRGAGFKLGLRGTVRMETPVLYFYDSREETVSVNVRFARGVITEWYPQASRVEPTAALHDSSLNGKQPDGSISWGAVTVAPGLRAGFPAGNQENHYYAARQTASTPVLVKTLRGEQREKFLFYRGVANFEVPVAARLTNGGQVLIENHGDEEIPGVILFERRGEKVGFRVGGTVKDRMALELPALAGTMDSLGRELEGLLVSRGLYQDEAHAMVETWRNSWFEEGSRLLYLVPDKFVNAVLPLSIRPAPVQTVRVFVGRLELVTPATQRAVERALGTYDGAALSKYGRFLEPILQAMMKKEPNPARVRRLQEALNSYWSAEVAKNQRGD